MSCIYCFLKDQNQYKLKKESREIGKFRFEEDLKRYKENFINGLSKIECCEICSENHDFMERNDVRDFLEELRKDIQSRTEFVERIFNNIINIYMEFISRNHENAYHKLVDFLKVYSTNYTSVNTIQFVKPMFRIRERNNVYDEAAIEEYFHIPFSKRYLVGNQRFSMTGHPMSYMAESLQIALAEIGKGIDEVNVALFFPKYSSFWGKGMYDVSNGLSDSLDAMIINTCDNKGELHYEDEIFPISKGKMKKLLADYILYQILNFPTQEKSKGVFIQEYVLPQLMMEVVQNRGKWVGIQYQTTKLPDYVEMNRYKPVPKLNYCFWIPYIEEEEYNKDFLGKFFYEIYNSQEEKAPDIERVRGKIQECREHCKNSREKGYIMKEYDWYITQVREYFEKALVVYGDQYSKTKVFEIESTLLYRFIENIDKIICNPQKYGIVTCEMLKQLKFI